MLTGFFKEAPQSLWPRAVVIEHLSKNEWQQDCIADMLARGLCRDRQDPQQHAAGARLKSGVPRAGMTDFTTSPSRGTLQQSRRCRGCRSNRQKSRPPHRVNRPSRRVKNRRAIPIPRCRRQCASPANHRYRRNCRARCRTNCRCAGRADPRRRIPRSIVRGLHELGLNKVSLDSKASPECEMNNRACNLLRRRNKKRMRFPARHNPA